MVKHYITLPDGRKVRVEANMNAIGAYLAAKGTDSVAALADISSLKFTDLSPLMAACANEGEHLDGRESTFTADDFGRLGLAQLPKVIAQFLDAWAKQASSQMPADESEAKKKE